MKTSASRLSLTSDRLGILSRTAVWRGHELIDLYLDWLDRPNLVGAIVGGKVTRFSKDKKIAFMDCGMTESISIPIRAQNKIQAGDLVAAEITATSFQGKAWQGRLVNTADITKGLIQPPPTTWQQAITDLKGREVSSILFQDKGDFRACNEWLEDKYPCLLDKVQDVSREPVHPDLSDRIETLLQPHLTLTNGVAITIQQTEAMVAIDIDATDSHPLTANLLAITEIMKQIRLRNLSGIIMVDLLKMASRTDAHKLLEKAKTLTQDDPAKMDIFGLTKLGLLEMTRRRRGPSLLETMKEAEG